VVNVSAMGDELPLLTMVKSKEIDEKPVGITEESLGLLSTLSSLCSFYSVDDFIGFLFSEKFQVLIGRGEPWVVFEIGMYLDHQKNMQLIATNNEIILVDNVECGWNDGAFKSNDRLEILRELKLWCELVFNPKSRFE
tara:strand:+ start:1644 stop:2057 length:414 start_codon:yes stop_codon:yes gene_type:complete